MNMRDGAVVGLIVGGILPAFCFAAGSIFNKLSVQAGMGLPFLVVAVACGVLIVGFSSFLFLSHGTVSSTGMTYAVLFGLVWGLGSVLVTMGISFYGIPLSKLLPLYNLNTLFGVLLSLWIFSEWQHVHVVKLLIGTLFVTIGGILVALA